MNGELLKCLLLRNKGLSYADLKYHFGSESIEVCSILGFINKNNDKYHITEKGKQYYKSVYAPTTITQKIMGLFLSIFK